MPPCDRLGFVRLFELLARVLADRLEHPEAAARPAAQEALVDERLQLVEVGVADGLGRLEREAAGEDGEPAEQALLLLVEQVVAPLDRRPQRALPLGRVAARRRSGAASARSRRSSSSGRQQPRPRGGELDRERQPVEPAADLAHDLDRPRAGCRGALDGRARPRRPPGAARPGTRARRRCAASARLVTSSQVRALREQLRQLGAAVEQVLEVVEQEQHRLRADVLRQARLRRRAPARSPARPAPDRVTAASGTQKTPSSKRSTSSAAACEREPGLAGPAGARQRDAGEPRPRSASAPRARAPCRRAGSAATGRFVWFRLRSGGKSSSPSWNSRSGSVRSFSRCSPRSGAQCRRATAGRLGDDDLAAVAGGSRSAPRDGHRSRHSPRRSARLAGVDPHPHADRPCERCAAPPSAAATASAARAKATKKASPCVSTSTPPWRANASRSTRRCSASSVRVALALLARAAASTPRCR